MPVAVIALTGLLFSVAVHIAAIRGIDVEATWPNVWVLHYSLFPILALTGLIAVAIAGEKRLGFRAFIALIPVQATILLAAAFLYALANLFILAPLTGMGAPMVKDSHFAFNDHGTIHEVSEDEFHAQRSLTVRLYSSIWLYLYLFAAVYLLAARRPSPADDVRAP